MVNKKLSKQKSPVVLIILDGWGIDKPNKGNAITLAKTPVMDKLFKKYPNTLLLAHGKNVGLPVGQDGNSEAGHLNLGGGRLVEQDSVFISKQIKNGQFFNNPAFLAAINHAKRNKANLHLLGLISGEQSAHAEPEHLRALLKLTREKKVKKVFLHLITDGRDSSQFGATKFVNELIKELKPNERVATIQGRFYAMDRKKKWSRLAKAYNLMVLNKGLTAKSPLAAITQAYNRQETDEFIKPTVITNKQTKQPVAKINDNDSIIFFNLRSDRARQLSKPFVQDDFSGFKRKKVLKNLRFVAMTDFGPDLDNIMTAFMSEDLVNSLPAVLKNHRQLYMSEAEKYAHMTYFFNGGYADPIGNEERLRIPSPDVYSYDKKPKMSTPKLTKELIRRLNKKRYDFIAINLANPDMVAHTGNLKAGIEAVESVDKCVGQLVNKILQLNGTAVITADHGNIEEMINLKTGEIDTKHSTNPVPFIVVNKKINKKKKIKKGILSDVAPTILKIMDVPKPKEMTGKSLL